MIDSATSPHVSLSLLPQEIHHGQGLFVRIQRDCASSDRFAELVSLLAGELVATVTLVKEGDNVAPALVVVIGCGERTVEFARACWLQVDRLRLQIDRLRLRLRLEVLLRLGLSELLGLLLRLSERLGLRSKLLLLGRGSVKLLRLSRLLLWWWSALRLGPCIASKKVGEKASLGVDKADKGQKDDSSTHPI